jgi:hypothetical protein
MAASGTPFSATFGFLTVVDDPEQGLFGGYLALNAAGRPIEFHCTAPVKANRAQEILYGPTLAPYVEGELIGGALLGRAKSPPLAVFADRIPLLAVRRMVDAPVVLSLPPENGAANPPRQGDKGVIRNERDLTDKHAASSVKLREFRLGGNRLAVPAAQEDDLPRLEAACSAALAEFDLWEPFSRIREALQEARSAAAARPSRQAPAA